MNQSIYDLFLSFGKGEFKDEDCLYLLHNRNINANVAKTQFTKTYRDLYLDSLKLIDHFSKEPNNIFTQSNQKMAIVASNSYEWIITFWAIIMSGNKAVLLDSNIKANELKKMLEKTEAVCAFVSPEALINCNNLDLANLKIICFHDTDSKVVLPESFHTIFGDNIIDRENLLEENTKIEERILELNRVDEKEIVFLHTSGTTGDVKFVGLSSKNLMSELSSLAESAAISRTDRFLQILPMYHVLGLISYISPTSQYIPITLLRELNGENIVKAIQKTKISSLIAVPALWQLFYDEIYSKIFLKSKAFGTFLEWYIGKTDGVVQKRGVIANILKSFDTILLSKIKKALGENLRIFVSGGAKGNLKVSRFFDRMGIITLEGYGLTETTGPMFFNKTDNYKIGSAGLPLEGVEVRIKNKNEGCGEVWVKGPSLFKGYYKSESTRDLYFDEDGFYNTGDLGQIDKDGHLFLNGRKKDVIVLASGKNVYPDDLESTYANSPYFKEFAIIGRKDQRGYETVHAVICPDLKNINSAIDSEDIYNFVQRELINIGQDLPDYRKVTSFTLVDQELPKTTTKKYQKQKIKQLVAEDSNKNISWNKKVATAIGKNKEQQSTSVEDGLQTILKRYIPHIFKEKSWSEICQLNYKHDLGLDSILLTEILYTLENTFGTKIGILEYQKVNKLTDLITILKTGENTSGFTTLPKGVADHLDDNFSFFDSSENAVSKRIAKIENKIKEPLNLIKQRQESREFIKGNIENYIGDTTLPTGVVGPLSINGDFAKGEFFIPMATTEGTLVASVHRGIQVINASGGVAVKILDQQMIRTPVFITDNLAHALKFKQWVMENFATIKNNAESTTNHGNLKEIDPIIYGRRVTLRFLYTCGDAAGQNMCTIATKVACDFIIKQCSKEFNLEYLLDNNISGDKKMNFMNYTRARGKRITAEVLIPQEVIEKYFHTTPERIQYLYKEAVLGSMIAATVGFNAHYANMIAAIFTATGQDIASTHESAVGITNFEVKDNNLIATILLPSLITATVGGGTKLPSQAENLRIMECLGHSSEKLAEIIAGSVLAGELSIAAAHATGDFADAHKTYGR